jgi:hypothetical protein
VHHEFLRQGQRVNRWYYLEVLKRPRENVKRKTSVVEKQLLVPPSWQSVSSCISTDSWLFGEHEHNCASSPTLFTWPSAGRLFLIFQTEVHFERTTISERDYKKFADGATCNPEKRRTRTLSRSGNGIGSGASMQKGSILKEIRLIQLQACAKKL